MEPTNRLFDISRARLATNDSLAASAAKPVAATGDASMRELNFTDTIAFRSPVLSVDAQLLERNRVLPAGAIGAAGGPYKMLRTQVLRRLTQLGANTLAVLGPTAGSGKTLTAINLAIAIAAETNRTALLVDLDLRNPNIHRRFGITPELGVEECLLSGHPLQNAMVKIAGYDRLTILPARLHVTNSSELLTNQHTEQLVEEMRRRYANRVIIFDLPPVLQADDALAFSRHVQAGLLVVNEGKTKREDVTRSIELLRDLKIVGTTLNGVRDKVQSNY